MTKSNTKAREAAYKKWELLEEERGEEIYDYIEENPGETAYSLAKILKIPRPTLQNILFQLEKDGLLVSELTKKNNRTKKVFRVKRFEEYTHKLTEKDLLIPQPQIESILITIGNQKPTKEITTVFNKIVTEFSYSLAKKSLEYARKAYREEVTKEDLQRAYREKN